MISRVKYPRTYHLLNSPGITSDDKVLKDISHFDGKRVIVTEKMDGENTTIYSDGYTHARSIDGRHHPSRDWVKGFANQISFRIPHGIRICGENVFAKHSIGYSNLQSYFLGFSAWNGELCLSWKRTTDLFNDVGVKSVPVLFEGIMTENLIQSIVDSLDTEKQEGFVIRLSDSFEIGSFGRSVAKWVRKGHVQTEKHWVTSEIKQNHLSSE